jgi:hypothetical protein
MRSPLPASMKLLTAALLAVTAVACDDAGTTKAPTAPAADTSSSADVTPSTDAATVADTATSGPDTASPPTSGCDRTGFDSVVQVVESETGLTVFNAANSESAPYDLLSIELYSGDDYTGATGPGTFALDDPNYRTCSNCVLVSANCDGETCAKRFYAEEGTLVIDRWDAQGGRFSGRLENVKLYEVTIDGQTYDSTRVAGGETWCLPSVPFEAEIKALPVSTATQQPTCVAEGTGNLLEDNVKNVSWTNCLGETVNLHDSCGQAKAFWLVATAGWCSACSQFLDSLVEQHDVAQLTRAAVREKTPGLDMLVVLGENANREEPTLAYCLSYAEAKKLDPAMVVVDWAKPGKPIPLIAPPGSAIEADALGTTWDAINPYLEADAQGSVAMGYPWWALLDGRNMSYEWSDYAARTEFEVALGALLQAD